MKYSESLIQAQRIGGIVYKYSNYNFAVASSFWSFAIKVLMQRTEECMYEVISNKQTTYLDLDLKSKDYKYLPQNLKVNPRNMVKQCLKLLSWGYNTYLNTAFSLDHVTIGESNGDDKISYHIIIYDQIHA